MARITEAEESVLLQNLAKAKEFSRNGDSAEALEMVDGMWNDIVRYVHSHHWRVEFADSPGK